MTRWGVIALVLMATGVHAEQLDYELLLTSAEAMGREGRVGSAETMYRRVLSSTSLPHIHHRAAKELSQLLTWEARPDEARGILRDLLRRFPTGYFVPGLHEALARIHLEEGHFEKAEREARLAREPNDRGGFGEGFPAFVLDRIVERKAEWQLLRAKALYDTRAQWGLGNVAKEEARQISSGIEGLLNSRYPEMNVGAPLTPWTMAGRYSSRPSVKFRWKPWFQDPESGIYGYSVELNEFQEGGFLPIRTLRVRGRDRTSITVTGLKHGGAYAIRVRGINGAGALGPYSNYSAPVKVDLTPPTRPIVIVSKAWPSQAGTYRFYARWDATDPESGISEYRYRIRGLMTGNPLTTWTTTGSAPAIQTIIPEKERHVILEIIATNRAGLDSIPSSTSMHLPIRWIALMQHWLGNN